MSQRPSPPTIEHGRGGLQFRVIFAVTLPVHLFACVGARLRPAHWRGTQSRSLFAEAWDASATTARLAFAG